MSGQAGAQVQERYFRISLLCGELENIEPSPVDEGTDDGIDAYFEKRSAPYRSRLEEATVKLRAIFEEAVRDKLLPITEYGEGYEYHQSAVFEDGGGWETSVELENRDETWQGTPDDEPALITVRTPELSGSCDYGEVTFAVADPIRRSDVDWLTWEVWKILADGV